LAGARLEVLCPCSLTSGQPLPPARAEVDLRRRGS
jgi:hypothetical protein